MIKRNRVHYWSCTKVADWIRGTPKPAAADLDGWDRWETKAKLKPFRYWVAEELLDIIQDVVHFPTDLLYTIKYKFNNRFITRTHALTSTLPRWDWHEFDTRILHCMFDELVNFVEVEQAWWNIAWDPEARKKYNAPRYAWGYFRWRTWRCPQAGMDSLTWATGLKDTNALGESKPTPQAQAAKEVLELYNWWKVVRPARPDPYEASGWSALCAGKTPFNMSAEISSSSSQALSKLDEMEQQYQTEDDEMLIRLVRVRHYLWT